jgi:hypothetical protein
MNMKKIIFFSLLCAVIFTKYIFAGPTFKIHTGSQSLEKGGVYQFRVEVGTNQPIDSLMISSISPDGFIMEPIAGQGIIADTMNSVVIIKRLEAGSAQTVGFRIWPPDFWGKPRKGIKRSPYYTREGKNFSFNAFYTIKKDSMPVREVQTFAIDFRYTTSIGYYILFGLLGIFIGHIIKVGTRNRTEIRAEAELHQDRLKRSAAVGRFIFMEKQSELLTILTVGFGVLLVLAKDGVPVNGWHQAISLGIGLAILTDEQLLSKIKA